MGETRSIGELGTQRAALDLTFGYFGLVVRVHPDASDLDEAEFVMAAADIDEASDIDETGVVRGLKAVINHLQSLIHPEDWDTFWRAAKANRQQLADLMLTARSIVEAVTGFPTGQPSGSPGGRTSTGRKSKAGSSSRARNDQQRALHLLHGRPDMQMAVVLADEARQAAG